MNLFLTRKVFALYGITGEIRNSAGVLLWVTLEHAYLQPNGSYLPKVAPGGYNCVRHPPERLPYETFMLENVPPFMGAPVSGILLHVGNYNNDSKGCLLLGMQLGTGCILDSRDAFEQFMELQKNVDSFALMVS
jgi:hypothetical protein